MLPRRFIKIHFGAWVTLTAGKPSQTINYHGRLSQGLVKLRRDGRSLGNFNIFSTIKIFHHEKCHQMKFVMKVHPDHLWWDFSSWDCFHDVIWTTRIFSKKILNYKFLRFTRNSEYFPLYCVTWTHFAWCNIVCLHYSPEIYYFTFSERHGNVESGVVATVCGPDNTIF